MNHFQQTVAQLEREHPAWQCWHVPCYPSPDRWCAQRWDGTGDVLSTTSPDDLEDAIGKAEADDG